MATRKGWVIGLWGDFTLERKCQKELMASTLLVQGQKVVDSTASGKTVGLNLRGGQRFRTDGPRKGLVIELSGPAESWAP